MESNSSKPKPPVNLPTEDDTPSGYNEISELLKKSSKPSSQSNQLEPSPKPSPKFVEKKEVDLKVEKKEEAKEELKASPKQPPKLEPKPKPEISPFHPPAPPALSKSLFSPQDQPESIRINVKSEKPKPVKPKPVEPPQTAKPIPTKDPLPILKNPLPKAPKPTPKPESLNQKTDLEILKEKIRPRKPLQPGTQSDITKPKPDVAPLPQKQQEDYPASPQELERIKANVQENNQHLKSSIIVTLVIILVLLLGGGVYYFTVISKTNPIIPENSFTQTETPVNDNEENSFMEPEATEEPVKAIAEENSEMTETTTATEETVSTIEESVSSETASQENQFTLKLQDVVVVDGTSIAELNANLKSQQEKLALPAQFVLTLNNEKLSLAQLEELLGINIYPEIKAEDPAFAFVMAKENEVVKSCLVLKNSGSPANRKSQMTEWEKTFVGDLRPLFFDNKDIEIEDPAKFVFLDSLTFPNGRVIEISQTKDLSLEYSVLTENTLICTAPTTMEKVMLNLE